MDCTAKPLVWIGSSYADFAKFPGDVQDDFGYRLWRVENGELPLHAKPLKGFGDAGVVELIQQYRGDTFGAIYTVRIRDRICVLHCFQKKASSGIKTSKQDLETIKRRLAEAEELNAK